MTLNLHISPCPNDTFMFDALVNRRIDLRGLDFDVRYLDIEQLNFGAMAGAADITKISYAVLPLVFDRYEVLDSGSALGYGNGPLLVAKSGFAEAVGAPRGGAGGAEKLRIAVPGEHTTANLLMQRLFPELTDRRPVLFSEIAPAVARGEFDAGVLIHEGRFTYRDHGLELIADLGEQWAAASSRQKPDGKSETRGVSESGGQGLPLPLGAIVAARALPAEVRWTVNDVLRASIEYAFAHPAASRGFVKEHARELDDAVIDNHIALFVNENSLSLSPAARQAIQLLTGVKVCGQDGADFVPSAGGSEGVYQA